MLQGTQVEDIVKLFKHITFQKGAPAFGRSQHVFLRANLIGLIIIETPFLGFQAPPERVLLHVQ